MNIWLNIILWVSYLVSLYFSVFWFLIFIDNTLDRRRKASTQLTRFPLVSVIVPAYNEQASIIGTLQSLLKLDYPKEKLEIVVVNDGSKDNTKKIVEDFIRSNKQYNLKLINQKNQGKGAALNTGLSHIKGEFFACLDADSFVYKYTLKRMLNFFEEKGEKLVIATPIMRVRKPKTLIQKIQKLEYIVIMFIAKLMSHVDCLFVAPGPFSLYRTKVIRDLGGFDPKNITEDQEIAYRVQSHHMKLRQCTGAFVETIAPQNLYSFYRQRNRWFRGGLVNALKYKHLLWNKNYGDFGFIQMSINLLLFFLATVTIFFTTYYLIWPIITALYDLSLVGFDFWPYLKNFTLYVNILHADIAKLFVLFFMMAISLIFFFFAHKNSNERISTGNVVCLIPYFLVYYLILSFIAVVILVEISIGKKEKW